MSQEIMNVFEERIKALEELAESQSKRIDKLESASAKYGDDLKLLAQSTRHAMASLNDMLVAINKVIFGTNYASDAPPDMERAKSDGKDDAPDQG